MPACALLLAGLVNADTVIDDGDRNLILAESDLDPDSGRRGMTEHIRDPLLHDAEDHRLDRGGHLAGRKVDGGLNVESGCASLVEQALDAFDAEADTVVFVTAAQDSNQGSEVRQRFRGLVLDPVDGFEGRLGCRRCCQPVPLKGLDSDIGVEGDDREFVAESVVEVSRELEPFALNPHIGLLSQPLVLQTQQGLLLRQEAAPGGSGKPEGDGRRDERERRDRLSTQQASKGKRIIADPEARGHDEHHDSGTDGESGQPHLGDGVESGHDGKGDTDRGEVEAVVGEGAENAEDEHRSRQTAAQKEGSTEAEGEDKGQRPWRRLGVGLGEGDDDSQGRCHCDGEDDVCSARSHLTSIGNRTENGHRFEPDARSLLDVPVMLPAAIEKSLLSRCGRGRWVPRVGAMNTFRSLSWPLIIPLGLLGLVRPIVRIVLEGASVATPVIALTMTGLITIVWTLVLGLSRAKHLLVSGIATGLVYAIGAIILSGILSPILLGHLDGPLADPIAIIPMLLTNVIWGVLVGALALAARRIRAGSERSR